MATVITEGNASLVDQSTPLLDKLPLTEFFSDHFQPATLARAKRATGATWCEAKAPGSAMRFLGHRTPGLAYKHYVDPRFIDDERATPPTLTLPAKRKGGAA